MNYNITSQKYHTKQELELLKGVLGWDRDSLLVRTAQRTGAREIELTQITKSDMNPVTCTIYIRGAKGSLDREISIPQDLFNALYSLPSHTLFPISTSRVRQIWYKIRPFNKKFHCFRHMFAIALYRATKDIMLVKQALGHVNIANTMVYAAAVDYEENMAKIAPSLESVF